MDTGSESGSDFQKNEDLNSNSTTRETKEKLDPSPEKKYQNYRIRILNSVSKVKTKIVQDNIQFP